jgi:DNA-binding MarR family transcriptional regulator
VIERFGVSGWVERRPSLLDSRSYALHLTPAGQELIAFLAPQIRAHEQEMAAALTAGEVETLLTLLAKMAEGKP